MEDRVCAPGILINNPKIIDLFSFKFYGGPHKGGFGIVDYNPRRSYYPLVPKQYTFNAAKGSLQKGIHITKSKAFQRNAKLLFKKIFSSKISQVVGEIFKWFKSRISSDKKST